MTGRRAILIVSIHAPARGATGAFQQNSLRKEFQFTRPQGARHVRGVDHAAKSGFNSRARKGRDATPIFTNFRSQTVSIHAPARGATWQQVFTITLDGFNSRARKGRDFGN